MVRSSKDAMAASIDDKTNVVGTCQLATRTWFDAPSAGDVDGDKDADAVDGWKREPMWARHEGDRNPPPGKPLAFNGGSKGYGHRCISWTGGTTRSTDMSNGRYLKGHVGFATIAQIEQQMGVRYLGWSETMNGLRIPEEPKPAPVPPPKPRPGWKTAEVVVATNNVMSLPKNPQIVKTLLASTTTPTVVGLQELDPESFQEAAEALPGWNLVQMPDGHNYASTIMFDEKVWEFLGKKFVKQYDGKSGISYTRHFAVVRLRHKALGFEAIFMSYHAVTAGKDAKRVLMRAKGKLALRKEINAYKKEGVPIFVFGDFNSTVTQLVSATLKLKHKIDHIYFWNGKTVTGSKQATRTVDTRSDHDVFIARLNLQIKK